MQSHRLQASFRGVYHPAHTCAESDVLQSARQSHFCAFAPGQSHSSNETVRPSKALTARLNRARNESGARLHSKGQSEHVRGRGRVQQARTSQARTMSAFLQKTTFFFFL